MEFSKKILCALFTAVAVLTGCNQSETLDTPIEGNVSEAGGCGVVFRLQANAPSIQLTRSAEDSYTHEQGTADEYLVKTARVYLYDSSTKLFAKSIQLTDIKRQGSGPDGVVIYETSRISVPQGSYDVFVTANTDRVINQEKEEDFLADIDNISYTKAHIEDISSGIVMTNRASANHATLIVRDENNSDNVVNILLERVLARIDVAKSANEFDLTDNTGRKYAGVALTRYSIVNLPKYYYSFRHTAVLNGLDVPEWNINEHFGNVQDVNGYVIDPYFFQKKIDATQFRNADKYYENYFGDFHVESAPWTKLKDVAGDGPQYNTMYCLENCMLAPAQKNAYSTGIVFEAKMTPNNNIYQLSGSNLELYTGTALPEVLYYYDYNFYNSAEALAKAIGVTSSDNLDMYNTAKFELTDEGYRCYYTYWIRHLDNNRPTNMGVMEFAIVRNNLYRLLVTHISGLGNSSVMPNPETPDEGETYLKIILNVKPWIVRDLTNIVL